MADTEHFIGIDIGGTYTKVGLITNEGILIRKETFESASSRSPEEYLQVLVEVIYQVSETHDVKSFIRGIGVGAPTANYHSGRIEAPVNLAWHEPLDIRSYLEILLNIPVFITNDANLAALGELHFGMGGRFSNLIVVTLGTGVGAGIIINRKLIHGIDDLAGEIGHMTIVSEGRVCSCGKKGCLETYVSIRGLVNTYQEINRSDKAYDPIEIFHKAQKSDKKALKAIQITGNHLGYGLANVGTTLAPECIVLSGGLANMGEMLLCYVSESFERNILSNLKGKIELVVSDFRDNDLSMLGASKLVETNLSQRKKHINQ